MPFYPSPRLKIAISLVIAFTLAGCQAQAPIAADEKAAQESFKAALHEIENGNSAQAESLLQTSIDQDPANSSRPRAALASIYAERAGVRLQDWLDPFYNASQDIDSKSKMYKRSDEFLKLILDEFKKNGSVSSQKLTAEELEVRKKVAELIKNAARVGLGLMVTLDVFQQLPFLTEAQMVELDRAIHTLYKPDLRLSEEARLYLGVLSIIRLVNNVKQQLGNKDFIEYLKSKESLCNSSPESLKKTLVEIRASIFYLYKGLEVFPDEPANKRRDARRKIANFVKEALGGAFWNDIEKFLGEEGSVEERLGISPESMEKVVGMQLASDFCHMFGQGMEEESSANLFNPDEE